jgi:predicted RNA methylase
MASSLMGAYWGVGVDVDQDALEIAQRNFANFHIDNVDLLYSDVQTLSIMPGLLCIDLIYCQKLGFLK